MRGLHCPFRWFPWYPNGKDEIKYISRMVSHLKTVHLCSNKQKTSIQNAIKNDRDLFTELEDSLRVIEQ